MENFRADLHCHSNCSDGSLSPRELIFHAKEIGLSGISITDHDTVAGYEEAIAAAKEAKIWLGTGVEFSAVNEGSSVHILGYDIDLENGDLLALCARHINRRKERNREIFKKLKLHQMPIDEEKLEKLLGKGHPIGRPDIALEMVRCGYVQTVQEAFEKYLGDRKPCFSPGHPITADETIATIKKANGKAFLAHPHLFKSQRHIRKLLEKPFDGIECYYARLSPDQEQKWIKIAKERKLLISGGSDFHGAIKPLTPLGCSWVDRETFEHIFQKNRWKC